MTKQIITNDKIAKQRVPLSKAVKVGNLIFVSGMTPFDVDRHVAKDDFPAQMRQAMDNIKVLLEGAGSSLDKVVNVNMILTRLEDFDTMNEIYKTYFKEGNYPARTTIGARLHHQDFLLEIECVAEA